MEGSTPQQRVSFMPAVRSRAAKFMKHLALASKQMAAKEEKKQELHAYLEKLKSLSVKKAGKERIARGFADFEKRFSELIDREKRFFAAHSKDDKMINELKNKINNISVQLQSFRQLQEKMAGEEIKIQEEEKRESAEIKDIENDIRKLEKFYSKLKKSKKHPAKHLKLIETRLKSSRERLKQLKRK